MIGGLDMDDKSLALLRRQRAMGLDKDRTADLYAVAAVSALVATAFAGARIYSNFVLLRRRRREDWTIALSLVSSIPPIQSVAFGPWGCSIS